MNEDMKEKLNTDAEKEEGLSQEKFADLFKSLSDAHINDMLERAGLSEDTPEAEPIEAASEPENPDTAAAASGGNLEPEHISHILKMLGEDVVNEMLADAGLSKEDLPDDETPADGKTDEASAAGTDSGSVAAPEVKADSEAGTEAAVVKSPGKRKKRFSKKRFLLLSIFIGIILLLFAVNQISNNITLNSEDPIQYSEETDEISALEGTLIVNNVRVAVPTDGSENYSISYSWAEDDEKYPSVPKSITAVYSDKEGNKLYTISLYRSGLISKKELPKGKKVSTWFNDWETVTEGDILQNPLKSGDINGFYIYPQMNEEGTAPTSDYNNYSYYFVINGKNNVSEYVLEGVCIDENSAAAFPGIMDECIKNIKVK